MGERQSYKLADLSSKRKWQDFSCPQGPTYFPFSLIFHLQSEAQKAKKKKSPLHQKVSQQQLRINPVIVRWDQSLLLMLPWETEKG